MAPSDVPASTHWRQRAQLSYQRLPGQSLHHAPGMENPEYLRWPTTQNLAYRIIERLEGFPLVSEHRPNAKISIRGRLNLSHQEYRTKKAALCTFEVDHTWTEIPPRVICHEPWIKRGDPDWHIHYDGELCFELPIRWKRQVTEIVELHTDGTAAEYACNWLLNSARSLLSRHLFASRNAIARWPTAWEYWAHQRPAAEAQYWSMAEQEQAPADKVHRPELPAHQ